MANYESRDTNQNRNEESSNSFLLGVLLGGVVGAAAALLLAPKYGEDIRSKLNLQAGSFKEKTTGIRENVINKSSDLASKTSALTQGIVLKSTGLINKVKEKTTNHDKIEEESEVIYIPIQNPQEITNSKELAEKETLDSSEIRKRLEEAEKAFEMEESKVKQ
ncbi:MAG: YtxH domain-containing protein [Bacillus sp. (in: Bacteria)]|nr:YtxH domain-containing protein [Bacillus sp. (in: firmicutes)]